MQSANSFKRTLPRAISIPAVSQLLLVARSCLSAGAAVLKLLKQNILRVEDWLSDPQIIEFREDAFTLRQ